MPQPEDQQPPVPDPTPPPPSAATPNTEEPGPVPYSRFKAVNDELHRVKKEQEQAAAAKKQAAEAALAEQQQWQTLAETRQTEIEQLRPQVELAQRLATLVAQQLETEVATWPATLQAILPAADAPLVERLEAVDRTRPLAQELLAAQAKGTGTRYPSQHSGSGAQESTKDIATQALSKSYRQTSRRKPQDG